MNISAILLAAGSSTRFEGGHKLLAEIDRVPLVRCAAMVVARSTVREIVVVVGANASEVAKAVGPGRWRLIENRDASEGIGSSIRCGVQSINRTADGVLIALGDVPLITSTLIDRLISAFVDARGRAIVFPVSLEGRRGHPVIWPRAMLPALGSLSGDTGGKQILEQYRDFWRPVPCMDVGPYADIDTSADLDGLRALTRTRAVS
jgi:molybdenum cofactor cytidylyltransferase